MKTRRIYLQPNEVIEVMNSYGTSILKATAVFDHIDTCVVTYAQPGVQIISSNESQEYHLTPEPTSEPDLFKGDPKS